MRRLTLQGRPARERNAALDHPWIKLEKNAERNSCIYRAGRGEDLLIYLRLLIFDNNRRISRYSQIKRDHQAEGRVPLHVFGHSGARAIFDEVEVEH